MKTKLMTLIAMSAFAISAAHIVRAEDQTADAARQAKDDKADATKNAKKTTRKAKKNVRKATGTDTIGKDAKDKANDVKDDTKAAADKANNKINE
jgi:hypothetical protein